MLHVKRPREFNAFIVSFSNKRVKSDRAFVFAFVVRSVTWQQLIIEEKAMEDRVRFGCKKKIVDASAVAIICWKGQKSILRQYGTVAIARDFTFKDKCYTTAEIATVEVSTYETAKSPLKNDWKDR